MVDRIEGAAVDSYFQRSMLNLPPVLRNRDGGRQSLKVFN